MGAVNKATKHDGPLKGARVLVVEDDFFIGTELAAILSDAGADVLGPTQTIADALQVAGAARISAAIVDIRLGSETVEPVARRLAERRIPFLFYTGQARLDPVRAEWPHCRVIAKPALPETIIAAVASIVGERISN